MGGYIYSIGLVKAASESLQELVRASSSSLLVTLNNVQRRALACEIECHVPDYPSNPNVATAHALYGRSMPNTDGTETDKRTSAENNVCS